MDKDRQQVKSGFFTFTLLAAAALMVIAPLSLGTELEAGQTLKLVRIGLCAIGFLLALVSGVLARVGKATTAVAIFGAVYAITPLWSAYPLNGVAYRMVFLSALFFGLALGTISATPAQLRSTLRILGLVAAICALLVFYQYRHNPESTTRLGRLAIYGINANAVGMTAAVYLLFTVFLAITERGVFRWFGTGGTAILLLVLLATGSRASLAMAIAGTAVLLSPWLKRPGRLVLPAFPLAMLFVIFSNELPAEAVQRLTDLERNTRAGMWQAGIRLFLQSPVIGHGWLTSSGRSTGNLQNVYLQVLAEGGVVLGLTFIFAMVSIASTIASGIKRVSTSVKIPFYLGTSFVIAVALHGIAESSFLAGTTMNAFLFGFGLGLIEATIRLSGHTAGVTYPVVFSQPGSLRFPAGVAGVSFSGFDAHPPRHP